MRADEHSRDAEERHRRAAEVGPDGDPELPESTPRDG
jgi:hypothetical protein